MTRKWVSDKESLRSSQQSDKEEHIAGWRNSSPGRRNRKSQRSEAEVSLAHVTIGHRVEECFLVESLQSLF